MKFAIRREHKDFFKENLFIEFEGVFEINKVLSIQEEIDKVLALRLNQNIKNLKTVTPEKLFIAGHDLWRDSPTLKKIETQLFLREIASELLEKDLFRLGADQYFPSLDHPLYEDDSGLYSHFRKQNYSLQESSSLQGVQCAIAIILPSDLPEKKQETSSLLEPGNVLFFKTVPPHSTLCTTYLQIIYTNPETVYVKNDKDPHGNLLKKLGYSFGDRLKEKWHPLLN